MAAPGKAREYQLQAEDFEKKGQHEFASDFYERASRIYEDSGDEYHGKYCLGKSHVRRASSFGESDPSVALDLYERGIEAWNISLSTTKPDSQRRTFTLGNIRYIEGIRFSMEAELREKRAGESARKEEKNEQIMQLAMASASSLSAAHAKYDSAGLGKEMLNLPVYYSRMGSCHFSRSECFRFLAMIQEVLLFVNYGLRLLRDSIKELADGVEQLDKSYRMAPLPGTADSRKVLMDAATRREEDFLELKTKLPFDRQPTDETGTPEVKFTLSSGLDLMENLYSPILLILENAGDAWATDLEFKLKGEFAGEKELTIDAIPPHSEQLVSLTMNPGSHGSCSMKAELNFRSSSGESYAIEDEKDIPVLSCRQERGTGGILMASSVAKRISTDDTGKRGKGISGQVEHPSTGKMQCPHCRKRIDGKSVKCPHCNEDLIARCPGCSVVLPLQWDMCPGCGKWNLDKRSGTGRGQ